MRIKKLRIILTLVGFFVFFLPTTAKAQGTYFCEWDTANQTCITYVPSNNCQSGYFPGSGCSGLQPGACASTNLTCVGNSGVGGDGQNCINGSYCNTGLYCDLSSGFICKKCGGTGEICCPAPISTKCRNNGTCGAGNICTAPANPVTPPKEDSSYICNIKGRDGKFIPGINTALGCIPISDPNETAAFFLRWALGIAGGISMLLIIFATFIITTSSGDPKKVQGGKELLTAAIAGLVLIIFSTFILRIIGVNILEIF